MVACSSVILDVHPSPPTCLYGLLALYLNVVCSFWQHAHSYFSRRLWENSIFWSCLKCLRSAMPSLTLRGSDQYWRVMTILHNIHRKPVQWSFVNDLSWSNFCNAGKSCIDEMHHVIAVEMSAAEDGWTGEYTLRGIPTGVETCGQNGQIQSIWGNVWMEGGLTLCLWRPSKRLLCLCLGTCCLVTTPPHSWCICAAPSPNWGRRSASHARWPTPSPWHLPWHMSLVHSSCGGSAWSSPMCHQPPSLWGFQVPAKITSSVTSSNCIPGMWFLVAACCMNLRCIVCSQALLESSSSLAHIRIPCIQVLSIKEVSTDCQAFLII